MPAILNAANESAVKLFLEDKIKFNEIPRIINRIMNLHKPYKGDIFAYIQAEDWARKMVQQLV